MNLLKYIFNLEYFNTSHQFHLVDPSPWPLVAFFGALIFTLGSALYMRRILGGWRLILFIIFFTFLSAFLYSDLAFIHNIDFIWIFIFLYSYFLVFKYFFFIYLGHLPDFVDFPVFFLMVVDSKRFEKSGKNFYLSFLLPSNFTFNQNIIEHFQLMFREKPFTYSINTRLIDSNTMELRALISLDEVFTSKSRKNFSIMFNGLLFEAKEIICVKSVKKLLESIFQDSVQTLSNREQSVEEVVKPTTIIEPINTLEGYAQARIEMLIVIASAIKFILPFFNVGFDLREGIFYSIHTKPESAKLHTNYFIDITKNLKDIHKDIRLANSILDKICDTLFFRYLTEEERVKKRIAVKLAHKELACFFVLLFGPLTTSPAVRSETIASFIKESTVSILYKKEVVGYLIQARHNTALYMSRVHPNLEYDLVKEPEKLETFLKSDSLKGLQLFEKRTLLLFYCLEIKLFPIIYEYDLPKLTKSSELLVLYSGSFNCGGQ